MLCWRTDPRLVICINICRRISSPGLCPHPTPPQWYMVSQPSQLWGAQPRSAQRQPTASAQPQLSPSPQLTPTHRGRGKSHRGGRHHTHEVGMGAPTHTHQGGGRCPLPRGVGGPNLGHTLAYLDLCVDMYRDLLTFADVCLCRTALCRKENSEQGFQSC